MSNVEARIVEALATYLKDPSKPGLTTDLAVLARGLVALPVYADMGGALLIRPSGDVLVVHSNQEWTERAKFEVVEDPVWISRAYDACAQRYPKLASAIDELRSS